MHPDIDILLDFLRYPLGSTESIFERFTRLPNAQSFGNGNERSVFVPGSRRNKVLLIAHADTFWDNDAAYSSIGEIVVENGLISNPTSGLGADDRAGCAILWLLKDIGHSLLITSGEEKGSLASKNLTESHTRFLKTLNEDHQFMVQFDRCNGKDFKCYDVGSDDFRKYIEKTIHYIEADRKRSTDIKYLCKTVCGVN